MNIQTNTWLFQDDATTTGNGTAFKSGRNNQITIYITGTSTSRNIIFEGSDAESTPNWYPIPAVKLPELTITSSTTGNNEVYVIDLAHWASVRCRISSIAGGTVKITGRVVDVGNSLISGITTPIEIVGTTLKEQLTETDAAAGVLTFTDNFGVVEIFNTDSANAGTFVVNGVTINVPATKDFKANIGGTPGKTVTITGATTYIVGQYE